MSLAGWSTTCCDGAVASEEARTAHDDGHHHDGPGSGPGITQCRDRTARRVARPRRDHDRGPGQQQPGTGVDLPAGGQPPLRRERPSPVGLHQGCACASGGERSGEGGAPVHALPRGNGGEPLRLEACDRFRARMPGGRSAWSRQGGRSDSRARLRPRRVYALPGLGGRETADHGALRDRDTGRCGRLGGIHERPGRDPGKSSWRVDWADVRAANGHRAPYAVRWWEIGNEQHHEHSRYWMSPDNGLALRQYAFGGSRVVSRENLGKDCDHRTTGIRSDGAAQQTFEALYPPVAAGSFQVVIGGRAWTRVASSPPLDPGPGVQAGCREAPGQVR